MRKAKKKPVDWRKMRDDLVYLHTELKNQPEVCKFVKSHGLKTQKSVFEAFTLGEISFDDARARFLELEKQDNPPVPIEKREDWEEMIKEVKILIARLAKKPENLRLPHDLELIPQNILGAYLQGDIDLLTFVRLCMQWAKLPIRDRTDIGGMERDVLALLSQLQRTNSVTISFNRFQYASVLEILIFHIQGQLSLEQAASLMENKIENAKK